MLLTQTQKAATSCAVMKVVDATRLREGAGFPVRRPFPTAQLAQVDPFLLLDEMGPVNWAPGEAIGAPDHPHRGFETVTYLLQGRFQHKDSGGHSGELNPGDVQWMTAGAGVVHSEMPHPDILKTGGVIHGFQLWVNLPAEKKMIPPRYQEIPTERIPDAQSEDGKVRVRVIAGKSLGVEAVIDTVIPITYLHFSIKPGGRAVQSIPHGHDAFVYVFEGEVQLGETGTRVREGQIALLDKGDSLAIGSNEHAELLLLAGPPLKEPLVRHGPFVMNSHEEIVQAIQDYRDGKMGMITTEESKS